MDVYAIGVEQQAPGEVSGKERGLGDGFEADQAVEGVPL